ncbi:Hyalin [Symbiodinium sp. CCMP2456]|nr:Hyalin [Symbiodinium sp. CCMP2456]
MQLATLQSGNFNVTVNDKDRPAFEVEDISVNSCSPTVVTFSPAAADNCGAVTAAGSPSSGSEFPVGETEVTCKAVDAAGSTTLELRRFVECVGHGYHKRSHSNNIRSRRNRGLKKWLHRNRRLKKWWHRKNRMKKWWHYRRYWHR